MTFPIILDFVVVLLLIATILYAISLNRKLDALYKNREELQKFIENFSKSLAKAEVSMTKLRLSGEKVFSEIASKLKEGSTLRDDLGYLLERGEKLATSLEETTRTARDLHKKFEQVVPPESKQQSASSDPPSSQDAEPDLIQSLRNVR